MPRRLIAVNAALVVIAAVSVGLIVKQLVSTRPVEAPRARPAAATPAAPAAPAEAPKPSPQAYSVVAARNLFSPTRSETPGTGVVGGGTVSPVVKPNLHGVVLRDGSPVAYLEDPMTKRIAGYRVGDPIAGGTVQTISADAVIIARPDGAVDVRLRDPSKPRPLPPAPAQPGAPGQQPPVPGQAPTPQQAPGMVPPRAFLPPGQPVPQPMPQAVPGIQPPPTPGLPAPLPFQRPSPSLGRRLPPGAPDQVAPPAPAPQQ
jgi:hypothetical protein